MVSVLWGRTLWWFVYGSNAGFWVQVLQNSAAKAKEPYEALIELDELHIKYGEELKQAEFALEGIEESHVDVHA